MTGITQPLNLVSRAGPRGFKIRVFDDVQDLCGATVDVRERLSGSRRSVLQKRGDLPDALRCEQRPYCRIGPSGRASGRIACYSSSHFPPSSGRDQDRECDVWRRLERVEDRPPIAARAFFRGLVQALPWTLLLCMLLVAGTGLLVVWVFSPPLALPSIGLTIGSREILVFYFCVGLIGGSSLGVHRGFAELLDAAEKQSQPLLGPVLDRLLARLPLDDLDEDPSRLKAALQRALSAPVAGGSALERPINRLIARLAADRSDQFLGCLGSEPGLSSREHLRNALLRDGCTQQRASLAAAAYAIAGLIAVLCVLPPLAIYLLVR